jgi:hypothetical protein
LKINFTIQKIKTRENIPLAINISLPIFLAITGTKNIENAKRDKKKIPI